MVSAWFRRGEGPSPNGLGDPTPTLRYGSLWIDKSTAPWDHSLLLKTGFYCSCPIHRVLERVFCGIKSPKDKASSVQLRKS